MVYIIAEAGVDHEGDLVRARRLLQSVVDVKADCFKIQYYYREFRGEHRILPWLPSGAVKTLILAAEQLGIDFLITPHDQWALDWIINETDLDTIKIGSGDWHLLDKAIASKRELIISTGNRPRHRVRSLKQELIQAKVDHKLLHCVSLYPCPLDKANIGAVGWPTIDGYSDHTLGNLTAQIAVALGAEIIEKHMTLERDVEGHNDTFCSLLPHEWPQFVQDIRSIEQALAV